MKKAVLKTFFITFLLGLILPTAVSLFIFSFKYEFYFHIKELAIICFFIFYFFFCLLYLWSRIGVPIEKIESIIYETKIYDEKDVKEKISKNPIDLLVLFLEKLREDIEKKKKNIKSLVMELKEDKRQLEADNTLLRVLSHDLASPLMILKASCDAARWILSHSENKKLTNYLNKIEKSTLIIEKITTHVRDMIALRSGKKSIKLLPISLDSVLEECRFVFDDQMKRKNLELVVINHNPDARMLVERSSFMNQVFNNLISNAIKFSPRGKTIFIEALVEGDERYHLMLRDQGVGIPDHLIEDIFSPEKKTSRLGTDGEKGTGFGLPVVKSYIGLYDGTIEVESSTLGDQTGTTFHIFLKCVKCID